ncbi:hypothetical protein SEVIR_1G328833v4 [Setaria viridis]
MAPPTCGGLLAPPPPVPWRPHGKRLVRRPPWLGHPSQPRRAGRALLHLPAGRSFSRLGWGVAPWREEGGDPRATARCHAHPARFVVVNRAPPAPGCVAPDGSVACWLGSTRCAGLRQRRQKNLPRCFLDSSSSALTRSIDRPKKYRRTRKTYAFSSTPKKAQPVDDEN